MGKSIRFNSSRQAGIVVSRGQVMSLQEQAAFAHRLGEPSTEANQCRYPAGTDSDYG